MTAALPASTLLGANSGGAATTLAAVEATDRQQPGQAVFLTLDGGFVAAVTVGANPDMLTFTPDGSRVLVANEGEPSDYGPGETDPEGSVSVIDLADGAAGLTDADVTTVGFADFNVGRPRHAELDPEIRTAP